VDEELRVYLAAFETRLGERIGQAESRLDGRIDRLTGRIDRLTGRIDQVESKLSERIDQVESKLSERIDQVESKLSERIETVETNLLTEFHKWASPVEMRQRTHAAVLRAVDAEIEALAARAATLKRRTS
jgi:prefoldin subunit 5